MEFYGFANGVNTLCFYECACMGLVAIEQLYGY